MTVIKNKKTNTYEVRTYYKDWTGVRKQKTKRGFKRKCDAQDWERTFKLKKNRSLDMTVIQQIKRCLFRHIKTGLL